MLSDSWNYLACFGLKKLAVIYALALLISPAFAEDPPKAAGNDVQPEDATLRKARVQFLTEAVKHFEVQVGEDAVESKLHPEPVLVWNKPDEQVIDGAVFVYALATDPEAVLMLECARDESGRHWQYAFGPMSIYALTAKLDGSVVWEVPERKQFGQPKSVQYVFPYQLDLGEKFPE